MVFLCALLWAVGLWLPGDTMARPSFAYMGSIAREWTWAVLWTVYAVGMFGHTFCRMPPWSSYTVNAIGLALWSIYLVAIFVAVPWPWPAGLADPLAILLASFWLLVRTGADNTGDRRGD
jgi:hypothetical protein